MIKKLRNKYRNGTMVKRNVLEMAQGDESNNADLNKRFQDGVK